MEDNQKKAILLQICSMIANSSQNARRIMKQRPISSMKIVARNSKNTKDPNPLQTTLSAMSTKYPISVDKEACDEYRVPSELIHKGLKDTHQHGRILAKLELVDWWIEHSPLPNADSQAIIDVLRRNPRAEVDFYESINWEGTYIRYGSVSLERRIVRQKMTEISIPKDLKNQAILQVLAPSYVTPHQEISDATLSQLRELANASLPSKMIFANQARVLSSQLNPKFRFSPSIPQSQELTGPIRHAICQSRWMTMGYTIREASRSKETQRVLANLAKVVVNLLSKKMDKWPEIMAQVQKAKINGVKLKEILSGPGGKPDICIMVLKVIHQMKISMEHLFYNAVMSPAPAKIRLETHTNAAHVGYVIYGGVEKVNFRCGDMRGHFQHDGELIFSIVTNFTTLKQLTETIATIATYCRVGFAQTHGKTKKDMFEEAMTINKRNVHAIIGLSNKIQYFEINGDRKCLGILTLTDGAEYQPAAATTLILTAEMKLKNVATKQEIQVPVENETREIPLTVTIPAGPLDDFLDAKRRIERKFMFYMKNGLNVIENVQQGYWHWENQCIISLNSTETAQRVAAMAREHAQYLVETHYNTPNFSMPYLCFLYCFCGLGGHSGKSLSNEVRFEIAPSLIVDLSLQSGIMIQDPETNELKLFGGKISGSATNISRDEFYSGLLPQFEIRFWRGEAVPVATIKSLLEEPGKYKDGEQLKIFVANNPMIAKKNSRIRIQTIGTISRQVNNRIANKLIHMPVFTRKRPHGAVASTSSGASTSAKSFRPIE